MSALSIPAVHEAIRGGFALSESIDGFAVGESWWVDQTDLSRPGWYLMTDGNDYLEVTINVTISIPKEVDDDQEGEEGEAE